jgi:hypothetical protein
MRIQSFVGIVLLGALWGISAQAQSPSPFNLHVGGGIGVPVNPTANFAGISGTFQVGAGPNLGKHSSIVGEFMWQGLPPTRNTLLPVVNALCATNVINPLSVCSVASISASNNLYAITANYMYHWDGRRYGAYVIGGGGWYYRYAQLKNVTVAPGTVCEPAWDWWGYTCQGGFVSTSNVLATKGVSSGGVNGGVGITVKLGVEDSNVKFYVEARYHYSPQGGRVSTQLTPVTMGLRW